MKHADPLLTARQLNRALLARQHLLERSDADVPDVIEHLVGMQAQLPDDPYLGLWSRVRDFDPLRLSGMVAAREAVRIALMRSTIHLVTARDALTLRPLVQAVLERSLRGNQLRYLDGVDLAELETIARGLVDTQPRSTAELGRLLAERWPDRDPSVLANAARTSIALVQVPPRGLWGGHGLPIVTSLEAWLGRQLASDPSVDEVVLRYLRAFGPATPGDVRAWSGMADMREVLGRLRPRLRTFRDERARELLDVEDGLLPDPDLRAPIRFLPVYDNAVLGHEDRSRIVPADIASMARPSQENVGSVLIDGFVGGLWRLRRERRTVGLEVRLLRAVPTAVRHELEAEGTHALAFLARDAIVSEVRVDMMLGR